MKIPTQITKQALNVIFVSIMLVVSVYAQQTERERGVELFNQGNDKEAIEALKKATKKNKDDIEAWYYLGQAYARSGKKKDASKAYEKAAKSGDELLLTQFNELDVGSRTELLKSIRFQLEMARKSAEEYFALNSNLKGKKLDEWTTRTESLRDAVAFLSQDGSTFRFQFYPAKDVTTKARITFKPQPEYTERAREEQVQGVIRISLVLGADGKVHFVRPVTTLPHGLTAKAIKAARAIKFIPAMKDGQPVSQYVTVEYNFRIY